MRIQVTQFSENIEVIPEIFKDEKNPPKFIFRNPNSSDLLKFIWGGNAIDEAVFNCFIKFENKIILEDKNGKEIEYNTFEDFVKCGLSPQIAVIFNECKTRISNELIKMLNEAQATEKK